MTKVHRLNHAAFQSADIERQTAYYEEVLGLHVQAREGKRVHLATRGGTDAVILSAGDAVSLTGLAFQVGTEARETLEKLRRAGVKAELRHDAHPGISESVTIADPNGLELELFQETPLHAPTGPRGIAPLRLGHVAITTPDVQATYKFYQDILGFTVGDWVEDFFVFMRCGHEHHTVNFVRSERARMHHIAFEMQNSAALTASCDVVAKAGMQMIWGPVRHGPGHNIATYHLNPNGQIVELYTEMDVMTNDALGYYDPRPWHTDRPQRPKVWSTKGPRRDIWGPFPPENFLGMGV